MYEHGEFVSKQERLVEDVGSTNLVTVERTLEIIEMLADAEDGLSLSELSRRLNVNKNIVFRILATLEPLNYIFKSEKQQHYHLTFKISNLGLRQMTTSGLHEQCQPVIRGLAEKTGELARLAVVQQGRPIWIHSSSGPRRTLQIDPRWGLEVVLHAHATGKAWMSTLSEAELDELLGSYELVPLTEYTITDRQEMKKELAATRRRGIAQSWEEMELGVSAIAAPILAKGIDGSRRCVGTVSVAAPMSRTSKEDFLRFEKPLRAAAASLASIWPISPDE